MAAPPTNIQAIPSDLFLSASSEAHFHASAAMNIPAHNGSQSQDNNPIPSYSHPAPPSLPAEAGAQLQSSELTHTPAQTPPPPAPDPPRGESRTRSHSGSRSRSHSSERSGSDDEDSEAEGPDPAQFWQPIIENTQEACPDEVEYAIARGEHNALDEAYWADKFFPPVNGGDEGFANAGDGKIVWEVDRFQGTKEQPNNDQIMRSPVVHIGGYDWRIKLFPKGNSSNDYLSLYVECVTVQAPENEEYEPFSQSPFPTLQGEDVSGIKKRKSVVAQVGIGMYNPAEPRTHYFKDDAFRFSKQSGDYGYPYFYHRQSLADREHGHRQSMLRNDKLAFVAYIRVINDPTECLWLNDRHADLFQQSILTTSLRPFTGQPPHLAAFIPLLHFEPFREQLIRAQNPESKTVFKLQTILWKMYSRTHSETYHRGRRAIPTEAEHSDAVSCLKALKEALCKDGDAAAITELLGPLDADEGSAIHQNKLSTKAMPWIQKAVAAHRTPLATPALLALELQRQEFDRATRKWKKLTDRVMIDEQIEVGGHRYLLFAAVTHSGDLQSNKHSAYVRPSMLSNGCWYAYKDGRVTAMTHKQAITAHEGLESHLTSDKDKRRDSPFAGLQNYDTAEVIYMVMYIREDYVLRSSTMPREEMWAVPEDIRKGREWRDKANRGHSPGASRDPDLPFREEQDRFEREQREREVLAELAGAMTPDWPLTDPEGDIIMSDSEDDIALNELAGSTTLTQIPTKPSRAHKWRGIIDRLGAAYYEGEMLGDKYQGQGHFIDVNGDEYVGSIYQNSRDGYGKLVFANGDIYEGQFVNGQQHGQGKLIEAATGNVYQGGWQEGKKHGAFTLSGTVTEEQKAMCLVCYERPVNIAFYDCGHVTCCKQCATQMDSCPTCRKRVLGRLQIYGVKMTLE